MEEKKKKKNQLNLLMWMYLLEKLKSFDGLRL